MTLAINATGQVAEDYQRLFVGSLALMPDDSPLLLREAGT
jgi:hypothetical protein